MLVVFRILGLISTKNERQLPIRPTVMIVKLIQSKNICILPDLKDKIFKNGIKLVPFSFWKII
ncbi:hypothetical protein BpHYR1_015173 [Brachionus plicatilis]|uniref:Uncharacterized protein n=1 Tax=Brachionus plicatilis TaxID=10195 RepID=A0A3M7QYK0_BRAPC|nr:hypothetical protein BpHYR1_015173 [Brachionus plicatilis]